MLDNLRIRRKLLTGEMMKTIEEIRAILREKKPYLEKKFNVIRIWIFGSYASGNASTSSDVDILVEFSESPGWEFVDLKEYLESILGLEVDLVTVNALRPSFRENVLRQLERV